MFLRYQIGTASYLQKRKVEAALRCWKIRPAMEASSTMLWLAEITDESYTMEMKSVFSTKRASVFATHVIENQDLSSRNTGYSINSERVISRPYTCVWTIRRGQDGLSKSLSEELAQARRVEWRVCSKRLLFSWLSAIHPYCA